MKTHSDASDRQSSPSSNFLEFKATAFFAHVAPLALRWALAVTILSAALMLSVWPATATLKSTRARA